MIPALHVLQAAGFRNPKRLLFTVPAGVSNGNYIPLKGQGNVGARGGSAGDIIVFIEELEHDLFERQGDDIYYELPISITQAALGDSIEVPTLDGRAKLKIPPGTQSAQNIQDAWKGNPAPSAHPAPVTNLSG